MGICEGRVAIVTGAGRGLGRSYALELAREGAAVVINDLGVNLAGTADAAADAQHPADQVVREIESLGGVASADYSDVTNFDSARRLVEGAVERHGRLDVLINNAGIIRDRMLVNMSEAEFDAVVAVHMKGSFATMKWAGTHWRQEAKAGNEVDARIINTTSGAGLYGNVGQINYGAAKAGLAAMAIIASMELGRYGVTANAICPRARTRMTENLFKDVMTGSEAAFDRMDTANVARVVTWLASPHSRGITGRVISAGGGRIAVPEGWTSGPQVPQAELPEYDEIGRVIADLLERARPPTFSEAMTWKGQESMASGMGSAS